MAKKTNFLSGMFSMCLGQKKGPLTSSRRMTNDGVSGKPIFIRLKLAVMIWLTMSVLAHSQSDEQMRRELERMAATYTHFSLTAVIGNRELRLMAARDGKKDNLAVQQEVLVKELRALGRTPEALVAMLKHPNPKVRTLALGALYQREEGRDLPMIASLMNDSAETFPDLHESMNSAPVPNPMSDLETTQSVAQVAQTMLGSYLKAEGFYVVDDLGGYRGARASDTKRYKAAFTQYWVKHQDRQRCASWFLVKLRRATRQTSPLHAEYEPKVKRVMAEINALPPVERAWTLLYVHDGIYPDVIPIESVVTALKAVAPESLMDFLQHKPGLDDPDLQFDDSHEGHHNQLFYPLAVFILQHARDLLRPTDAEAVLACTSQKLPKVLGGGNGLWFDAAVELKSLQSPTQVGGFVRAALDQYPAYEETTRGNQGLLVGALWKVHGMADKEWLVDWFYQPILRTGCFPENDDPVRFLRKVFDVKRADTRDLLTALVTDPRFDYTEWAVLKHMLAIANADLNAPLVSGKEVAALDQGLQHARQSVPYIWPPNQILTLASWRNLLRRHYGLPERALPKPPVPQKILRQPVANSEFARPRLRGGDQHDDRPLQMQLSPDGRWLAILQEHRAEIREVATRKIVGNIRNILCSPVVIGFFNAPGTLTVFDVSNGIMDWDVSMKQVARRQELVPFDEAKVGRRFGEYAFDATGARLAMVSHAAVGCYDIRTRQLLWQHENHGQRMDEMQPAVAMSWDGRKMAASLDAGRLVQLFDAERGLPLQQFHAFAGHVQSLVFSPDGKRLVTASVESGVRLWETATGKLVREIAYPVVSGAGALVFSPDGRWFAVVAQASESSATENNVRVGIFGTDTGKLHWELAEDRTASGHGIGIALVFSPKGDTLYTAAGTRLDVWPLGH